MDSSAQTFEADILRVQSISQVPLILDVCSKTTGMRFTAVARVTDDRWITCAVLDGLGFGLAPGSELEVGSTLCNEVRACNETIVIDHVDADEIYRHHHTPRRYGFQSYISVPIVMADGTFFGTLCGLDPEPRTPSKPEILGMFRLFAQLIAGQIKSEEKYQLSQSDLSRERATAKLREEFIAVVGHDLRNPLAALTAGLRMLGRDMPETTQSRTLLTEMRSTVFRMSGIVDNLIDFARGRLGGGIVIEMDRQVNLEDIVRNVAGEIRAVTEQEIETRLDLPDLVRCDPYRMGQLVSNLLGNAVTHGAAEAPILVEGDADGGVLRLSVTNRGEQIPEDVMPSLFQPFSRGGDRASKQGLGLGLYISAEIAKAHGGTLGATSTPEGTTFAFEMPLTPS